MILREILLRLGLDVDEAAFAKGELAAALVKASAEKAIDVVKELALSFKENVKEAIEYGDELNKAAQKTGVARGALQELRYAAQLADVSSETLNHSLGILARTMDAAKKGGKEQAEAFSSIGVKATTAGGQLRGIDDVFADIADKLSDMPDGAQKTATAMKFFGRAGADLIPLLNEGADGLAELRQEARDMGLVMSDEAVRGSEELNDNLERLSMLGKGLWRQVIGPLIPAMNELVKRFLAWRRTNAAAMAAHLTTVVKALLKVISALGSTMGFLVDNATALKAILLVGLASVAIPRLIGAMMSLEAASVRAALASAASWLLAAAPFVALGAIVAGLLLIFDDIRVYEHGGKSLYGRFKAEIEDWLKPRDTDPWFVTAVKDLVRLLNDAIKVIDEFDHVTDRWKPSVSKPGTVNAASPAWKRSGTAMGPQTAAQAAASAGPQELHWWEKLALGLDNGSPADARYLDARTSGAGVWDAFKAGAGWGPPVSVPARSGGGAAAPDIHVHVDVHPSTGMNEEQVGKIAADKVSEALGTQMSNTAADMGP